MEKKGNIEFLDKEPYKSIINILLIAPKFNEVFKNGVETKELRYLLVKDYEIHKIKGLRKGRGNIVLVEKLKKWIKENHTDKIKLNQNLPNYVQAFNKYLENLEKNEWIERPQKGYSILSENRKSIGLKQIQIDILNNRPNDLVDSKSSHTFYFDKIDSNDIKNNPDFSLALDNVRTYLDYKIQGYMSVTLGVIKKQKISKEWNDFINKSEISPILKIYLWVLLLFFVQYKVRNMSLCLQFEYANEKEKKIIPLEAINPLRKKIEKEQLLPKIKEFWFTDLYDLIEQAVKNLLIDFYGDTKQDIKKIKEYNIINDFEINHKESINLIKKIMGIVIKNIPYTLFLDKSLDDLENIEEPSLTTNNTNENKRMVSKYETVDHMVNEKDKKMYSIQGAYRDIIQDISNVFYKTMIQGSFFDPEIYHVSKQHYFGPHPSNYNKTVKDWIVSSINPFSDKNKHNMIVDNILSSLNKKDLILFDKMQFGNMKDSLEKLKILDKKNYFNIHFSKKESHFFSLPHSPFSDIDTLNTSLCLINEFINMPKIPNFVDNLFMQYNEIDESDKRLPIFDFEFIEEKQFVLDPLIILEHRFE